MKYENFVILISALDPDVKLIDLIGGLYEKGFPKIVIVDDGSKPAAQDIFPQAEQLGCVVAHHDRRRGKGQAIRTAIRTADEKIGPSLFYITADCDGQHTPDDIVLIAEELIAHPDNFVLGVRKFEKVEGKKVSYWVNYYQRMFFRVTNNGTECPDPRSGLRGFSNSLKRLALTTEGNSFDYELNFLDAATHVAETSYIPISADTKTSDPTSHFRPVVDLLGMYLKFWRYLLTSNISTLFDLALFTLFEVIFAGCGTWAIFVATVCARIISGLVSYALNRFISFRSRLSAGMEMVRYFIVFVGQMAASGIIVTILRVIPVIPTVLIKAVVDFFLFFVVYGIQKNWVFSDKADKTEIIE